jgi:hypothetical protein
MARTSVATREIQDDQAQSDQGERWKRDMEHPRLSNSIWNSSRHVIDYIANEKKCQVNKEQTGHARSNKQESVT